MTASLEKRRVLGACVKVDTQHRCAFFEALAVEQSDGRFSDVKNGPLEFPTRGSFRVVPDDLHIAMPAFGSVGFFAVDADPHFDETRGRSPSRFRAQAILPEMVRLVVEMPRASKESSEVGALLRKGVSLKNTVGTRATVMIRFTDGVIAGPFTLKQPPGAQVFTADEQSLHQPKAAWTDLRKLPLRTLGTNSNAVTVCYGGLPNPDLHLDFGPIDLALRKVLSELADQAQARAEGLTKGKAHAYSILLSKLDPTEHTRARMDALGTALAAVENFDGLWRDLLEKILAQPKVVEVLEAEKAKARAAAIEQFSVEQKTARDAAVVAKRELARVESELSTRKSELTSATENLGQLEKKIATAEADFGEKVRAEADRLVASPEKLVAAAALLRPFFVAHNSSTQSSSKALSDARRLENPSAPVLSSDRDAFELLKQNLELIGVSTGYAGNLSATLLAAFAAGLAVVVRGSMAHSLATLIRMSLFARRSHEFVVPVGHSELLDWNDFPSDAETDSAVLLIGANRSCLDAYAAPLFDGVLQARLAKTPAPGRLLLSLVEGPSGLPIEAGHCALGPIIHTDALPWVIKPGAEVRAGAWSKTKSLPPFEISADDYDELRRAIADWPNAAFDSAARLFLPALIHFHGLASSTAATTNAWSAFATWQLAPYLAVNRGSADAVSKHTPAPGEAKVREAHLRLLFRAQP